MKKIFTLIAAALTICSAPAAEDLTLNVSETVAFGDWGFDNSAAPTLNLSNWAGGGWKFSTALSQDDYCGVDFTMEPTVGAHVTFTITYEGGETQSLDIPEGTTSIKTDFTFSGGITQIGFSHGDWEGGADPAVITITSAVVKAHSAGEMTELPFADLNPGEDTSLKDDAGQTVTLNRYSTYPAWYFDPAISSDDYEKVVITFAEPIPDEGIQLNAESDTDGWSGTQIAGLTKGASKVTAYFSAKPGVNIKSIGFYYSWNSKQGTDDQTTLKIAKAELVKKAGTGTGINTIHSIAPKENDAIYTLSGQRVSTPAKGINIIGGKKIVIK
jgi:hypothetical protein